MRPELLIATAVLIHRSRACIVSVGILCSKGESLLAPGPETIDYGSNTIRFSRTYVVYEPLPMRCQAAILDIQSALWSRNNLCQLITQPNRLGKFPTENVRAADHLKNNTKGHHTR